MSDKQKKEQDLKDSLKIFWDALQEYKKGGYYNNFNSLLIGFDRPLKELAARMKVNLDAKKFVQDQKTNARSIQPQQPEPEEQEEEKVVAANNAEKKPKKRRSRKKKAE